MSSTLRAELLDDLADAEAIAPEWQRLADACRMPSLSPAWVAAWIRWLAPSASRPCVVVVRDADGIAGIAPFVVGRARGLTRFELPGLTLTARLAPLAAPGREAAVGRAIAAALTAAAPRPDLIALAGLPADSPWPAALSAGWPGGRAARRRRLRVDGSPTVALTAADADAWLAAKSSNFRGQMRRLRRQLAKASGSARWSDQGSLAADAEQFARLHALRWSEPGSSPLVAHGERLAPMLVEAGRALLDDGRLRLRVLEVDGEPVSAQLFIAAGGHLLYVNGGWDERFARLKPSMLGLLDAIEDGFARGDAVLDLGVGEQGYKQRFADGSLPVARELLLVPGSRLPLTSALAAPELLREPAARAVRRWVPAELLEKARSLPRALSGQRAELPKADRAPRVEGGV